jgi:hypothetical protein
MVQVATSAGAIANGDTGGNEADAPGVGNGFGNQRRNSGANTHPAGWCGRCGRGNNHPNKTSISPIVCGRRSKRNA